MRTQVRGTVTADRNNKTIRVVVDRRFQHPKYGKIVRGRTICHTHDENNEAKVGDLVEIIESRPHSALKRWELVRVIARADQLQAAAVAEVDQLDQKTSNADSEGESSSEASNNS